MFKLLIVEDDTSLGGGISMALKSSETDVVWCQNMSEARTKIAKEAFSLYVLDINLPDGNGIDLLKEIKSKSDTPVILLSANDMELDIVNGLETGADDYITKPFSLAVLRARVNTQLRRGSSSHDEMFATGRYSFNFSKMIFKVDGECVELSKSEQKLLKLLTDNSPNTVKRDILMDRIWTDGSEYVDENALSVTVKRLRDKLDAQECIKTVYGIGYVWK